MWKTDSTLAHPQICISWPLSNCVRIFHTFAKLQAYFPHIDFFWHILLFHRFSVVEFDLWNFFDVWIFFLPTRQTNLWKTKFHTTIPQIRKCGNAKFLYEKVSTAVHSTGIFTGDASSKFGDWNQYHPTACRYLYPWTQMGIGVAFKIE